MGTAPEPLRLGNDTSKRGCIASGGQVPVMTKCSSESGTGSALTNSCSSACSTLGRLPRGLIGGTGETQRAAHQRLRTRRNIVGGLAVGNATRKRQRRRAGAPLARRGGPTAITAPKLRCRVGEQHGALARTREGISGETRVAAGSDPEPDVLSPLPTLTTVAATARRSRRVRLGRNRATRQRFRFSAARQRISGTYCNASTLARASHSDVHAENVSCDRRVGSSAFVQWVNEHLH